MAETVKKREAKPESFVVESTCGGEMSKFIFPHVGKKGENRFVP